MKWSKACIIFGGPSVSAVFVTWMYDLKIMCVDLIDEINFNYVTMFIYILLQKPVEQQHDELKT